MLPALLFALLGAACGDSASDAVPSRNDGAAESAAGAPLPQAGVPRADDEPVLRCGYAAQLRGVEDPDCDSIARPQPPGSLTVEPLTTGSPPESDSDRNRN